MISCDLFRARYMPSTEEPALLEHLRACDGCLASVAAADPDVLFRALGGQDLLPPGGVEAFVGEVMREVRLRSAETSMARASRSWTRRLAVAATLAVGLLGGVAVYRYERAPAAAPATVAMQAPQSRPTAAARAVVETYDSETATIVEVPTEGAGDVQLVMVFDETLPADL